MENPPFIQSQKKIEAVLFVNPWRVFFWEAVLFYLTLGIGIVAAFKIEKILKIKKIGFTSISIWDFLLYFFLATLFIFFITRFEKLKRGKKFIFKTIFVLAVFWGDLILFSLWLSDILALIFTAILIFWWLKRPLVLIHDLAMILGIAGISVILGLRLSPWLVVLLLIILSIYDFIAVYKTKHMVKMAKEMIEHRAILALVVPQRISDFKTDLKEVEPGGRFLILGGGDVAFPLLLAVSLIPEGVLNSLIIAIFALAGLAASFYFFVSQKIRRPIPALPPITLFLIMGFLITLFL